MDGDAGPGGQQVLHPSQELHRLGLSPGMQRLATQRAGLNAYRASCLVDWRFCGMDMSTTEFSCGPKSSNDKGMCQVGWVGRPLLRRGHRCR
jgi:hypothetical protein